MTNHARLVLEAIWRPNEASDDDYVELYSIAGPTSKVSKKFLIPVRDAFAGGIEEAMHHAESHNNNLFYRGAIRYASGTFKRTHCLWLDVDLEDMSKASHVLHAISNFSLEPTFISFSGRRGYHAVWCLSEPITCPQTTQAKLKALAYDLDGDHGVASPLKGLRVIGSRNVKAEPPDNVVRLIGPPGLLEALNPYTRLVDGLTEE